MLVEFDTHEEALHVLKIMNGKPMFQVDGKGKPWVLTRATFSCSRGCFDSLKGNCVLVQNLVMEVNDYILQEKFRRYPSFVGAMVGRDPYSGLSLGYGFVKFAREVDLIKALSADDKKDCLGKPMHLYQHNARGNDYITY